MTSTIASHLSRLLLEQEQKTLLLLFHDTFHILIDYCLWSGRLCSCVYEVDSPVVQKIKSLKINI